MAGKQGQRFSARANPATLGAAIAYFLSPVDMVPEALLGPVGYVDDVALAAFVLSRLINAGHGAVAKDLWAGDEDLFDSIRRVLDVADEMVGSGLWKRLKAHFREQSKG